MKPEKTAKWLIQQTEVDLAITEKDKIWIVRKVLGNKRERGIIYKLIHKGEL